MSALNTQEALGRARVERGGFAALMSLLLLGQAGKGGAGNRKEFGQDLIALVEGWGGY